MEVAGQTNDTTASGLRVPRTTEVVAFFRRQDQDVMLLSAIADGDRDAFRQFYERHSEKVALALRQLCRGQLPEDLFQEVFMAVWRKAGTFDPQRGDVGGWLFTICRNKVYDQFRRSGPPEVELLESDSPQVHPDRTMRLSLQAAMGDLRSVERDALQMVYFGGFTYGQAAEQLDVPLGTLKSRLRSGLRKLTERLGGVS